jgi:K+-sensing histidine kinase KdpD
MPDPIEDDQALRLLTLVAHELRTPLTVTSGYLKMLAGERLGPLTDGQHKGIAASIRAADQLLSLATDLSDLAKIDRGELTAARGLVRASALIDAALSAPSEPAAPPVSCAQAGEADPWLSVDRLRVARALRTLVNVVARTLPESTMLHVTRRRYETSGTPWLAVVLAAAGEGPATLPASDALGRIDTWQGGLGVGLPLAQRILAMNGCVFGALDLDPPDAARRGAAPRAILVLLPIAEPDEASLA